MKATTAIFALGSALLLGLAWPASPRTTVSGPKPESYWQVDELRIGMRGHGLTVMKGTKIEPFQVEVLGILKNTNPGRDMILCRLSGLELEKTGVIAGMSGSPVYIENKLVGAVAYAWPFGKEPIAGVTPFCQMHSYVEGYERRDLAQETKKKPQRVSLGKPLTADGQRFDTVTVTQDFDEALPTTADGMWMVPLRTPLAATGFTARSLGLLRERLSGSGLVPVQGGGTTSKIADQEKNTPLAPGGSLAVAMVTGDFDMSGIGTVTHIEGNRVYGWGHPFFSTGECEYPLMTGYIHTVYPRQTVSFKMGSPLQTVGVINADVSTCIAGWLGRKTDMVPMHMTVSRETGSSSKTFNVEMVRQPALLSSLVYAVLTNSVDMEGDLPEELTAELTARIEVEGRPAIVLKDTYSGSSYSGCGAPKALYNQVASVVNLLANNCYQPVRINRLECDTRIVSGRRSAEIEAVELDSETYSPGETLKAAVFLRPYKGQRQRLPVELKLPPDLAEGTYTVQVCDDLANARHEVRDNPNLSNPQSLRQIYESLSVQTRARRTNLVVRVPMNGVGVALEGRSLPNLPPSMVQILGTGRRTGAQTISGAIVSRQKTAWVIQGSESVRFTVAKNKKVLAEN